MTNAIETTVWLRNGQLNKEQGFTLNPRECVQFQSDISVVDGKCFIAAADQRDFQVKEIALRFLSGGGCSLNSNNYLYCLMAGKYVSPVRLLATDYIANRFTAAVTSEELRSVIKASVEFQLPILRPYILCALLHMDEQEWNDFEIDISLKSLALEIREERSESDVVTREDARYDVLNKIRVLSDQIFRTKNRHVFDNSSRTLSLLFGAIEVINCFYTQFLDAEKSPIELLFGSNEEESWRAVGTQLNLALKYCEGIDLDKDDAVTECVACCKLMKEYYDEFTEHENSLISFIKGDKSLNEFGSHLGRALHLAKHLQKGRIDRVSENTAQKQIRQSEELLEAHMAAMHSIQFDKKKPSGFVNASFILFDGAEVWWVNNQNVLWISEESFDRDNSSLIERIVNVLSIDRLAVGEKLYSGKPMLAFFEHAGL